MGILIALAVANFQSNFLANRLASAAFKTQRDPPRQQAGRLWVRRGYPFGHVAQGRAI